MKLGMCALAGVAALALQESAATAQLVLPCFSDFGSDTVGSMPALGAPHNPTHLLRHFDTEPEPIVQASALGLDAQPVTFATQTEPASAALLVYDFAPNLTTILRAEATVSVSGYTQLRIMRAWEQSFGSVIGDVIIGSSGQINGLGAEVGQYVPNSPFRVRMDVNIITKTYALVVDDELDGFANDTRVTGLGFGSDPEDIDNVGGFGIGYIAASGAAEDITLAFDDVLLMEIPTPGSLALLGLGATVLLVSRRHR